MAELAAHLENCAALCIPRPPQPATTEADRIHSLQEQMERLTNLVERWIGQNNNKTHDHPTTGSTLTQKGPLPANEDGILSPVSPPLPQRVKPPPRKRSKQTPSDHKKEPDQGWTIAGRGRYHSPKSTSTGSKEHCKSRNRFEALEDELKKKAERTAAIPTQGPTGKKGPAQNIRKCHKFTRKQVYEGIPLTRVEEIQKILQQHKILEAQQQDPECVTLAGSMGEGRCRRGEFEMDGDGTIYQRAHEPHEGEWTYRVFLSPLMGRRLIMKVHSRDSKGNLPEIESIKELAQVFTWYGILQDISQYIYTHNKLHDQHIPGGQGRPHTNSIRGLQKDTPKKGQRVPNQLAKQSGLPPVQNKRAEDFFRAVDKAGLTRKPQVILPIQDEYENKPMVKLSVYGRPVIALLDTGAEVSIICESALRKKDHTRGYLSTTLSSPVSGGSVDGYYTDVKLKVGGLQIWQTVCIAPMDPYNPFQMIIGYDFFLAHGAILNSSQGTIRFAINMGHPSSIPYLGPIRCGYISGHGQPAKEAIVDLIDLDSRHLNKNQSEIFGELIKEYADILIEDVTRMSGANLPPYEPIFLSDTPIYQRQYRIPHSLFGPLRRKIDKFEAAGIVKKATSQWNSPVLAVQKQGGDDVRMVLDLRKINQVIQPLHYPLMRIEDILNRLGGSKVFSNIDLNNGYYNVKLADSIKDRFAFTTPWGRYQMERLPQGCVTSASVFQQIMNDALHELIGQGNIFVFQDDVIVHTVTKDEHLVVLEELFSALRKINMAVRPSKCKFFKDSIKFLGHIVDQQGSKPAEDNIKVIQTFEVPRTVRQVRSFLGTVNFYRKFIQDVTAIAAPLYDLIKKGQSKISWTEECQTAFDKLKKALVSAPVLIYPDFTKPFFIKCDASNIGVGGVLEQEVDGEMHPIVYCSRKLSHAERNYSVIEREALAIVYVLSQCRYLVHGYDVILKTDHKPLTYLFLLKDANQRLVRWLLHIQDFRLKIRYIPGKENIVADMLSRSGETAEILEVSALREKFEAITNNRIRIAQESDEACKIIRVNISNHVYQAKEYILDDDGVILKQVFPTRMHGWKFRVVVPESLKVEIMHNYHDRIFSGHLSTPKVIWRVKQVFTWEGMFRDISQYVKTCELCQRRNTTRTKAPFQPVKAPGYPMQRLNVDILGPFQPSIKHRNRYLIVYTDSMSRYVWASPLPNMEAATVAKDYIDNVFSLHGGSSEILTDRGTQFMSHIFQDLCKRLGIRHLTTSSYRPCANGIAERENSKILHILAHVCNKFFTDWDEKLPYVLYALRTNVHRSTGESPFFLLHAFDPIDPVIEATHTYRATHDSISEFVERTVSDIEAVRAEVTLNLTQASEANCRSRNEGRRLIEFGVGQQVLYLDTASYAGKNRKLKPRYKGPYRVTRRLGLVNYQIRNVLNFQDIKTVHVDKLKTYFPRQVIDDTQEMVQNRPTRRKYRIDNRCLYNQNMEDEEESPYFEDGSVDEIPQQYNSQSDVIGQTPRGQSPTKGDEIPQSTLLSDERDRHIYVPMHCREVEAPQVEQTEVEIPAPTPHSVPGTPIPVVRGSGDFSPQTTTTSDKREIEHRVPPTTTEGFSPFAPPRYNHRYNLRTTLRRPAKFLE